MGKRSSHPQRLDAAALLRFCSLDAAICQLFDYCGDVQFWIKDTKGCFRWVNREVLVNYSLQTPEQVLGKTDYDLSPAYLADQFCIDDERVLKIRAAGERAVHVRDARSVRNDAVQHICVGE